MDVVLTNDGIEIYDIKGNELRWKNFRGERNRFGSEQRNFSIRLPEDIAHNLHDEGWNIQYLESEKYDPGLKVSLSFNYPRLEVFQLSGKRYENMLKLDAETVANLDYAEIDKVDVRINARESDQWDGKVASVEKIWVYLKYDEMSDRVNDRYRYIGNGQYVLKDDEYEDGFRVERDD